MFSGEQQPKPTSDRKVQSDSQTTKSMMENESLRVKSETRHGDSALELKSDSESVGDSHECEDKVKTSDAKDNKNESKNDKPNSKEEEDPELTRCVINYCLQRISLMKFLSFANVLNKKINS